MTSKWTQQHILLPPTDVNDMVEYNSWTTNIKISDDNAAGIANTPVSLTSINPVTVYVNDVYHIITSTPVNATSSDINGNVTVTQPADSLGTVCFQVTVTGAPPTVVDPAKNIVQKLWLLFSLATT